HRTRALMLNTVANLLSATGNPEESLDALRRAQDYWERMTAAQPNDATVLSELASVQHNIGNAHKTLENRLPALAAYAQAICRERSAADLDPSKQRYRLLLGNHYVGQGIVQRDLNQWPAALAS